MTPLLLLIIALVLNAILGWLWYVGVLRADNARQAITVVVALIALGFLVLRFVAMRQLH